MKILTKWVMAATLICGSTAFSSCINDNDDNPVIDNLAEKLIGKWMMSTNMDGQPALTNDKEVITFVSPTKAYASRSRGEMKGESNVPPKPENLEDMPDSKPKGGPGWDDSIECDVKIEGNMVILTSSGRDGSKNTVKYQIKSISETEFACEVFRETPGGDMVPPPNEEIDGEKEIIIQQDQRYERVTRDYSEEILGLWEGHVTSEMGSEFDDGEEHRWEYKADGTYIYWCKDENGEWYQYDDEIAQYFVDGALLCTRWKENGEGEVDNREWWEIESIKDGVMKWKALRQKEDGTTYTATFEMAKVE